MDIQNVQEAKKILSDWERRKPRDTAKEKDVIEFLELLGFSLRRGHKKSHWVAQHDFLVGIDRGRYGLTGEVMFDPDHKRRTVKWIPDLRQIVIAAKTVIEIYEVNKDESDA